MSLGPKWTPEEERILKQMLDKKFNVQEICKVLTSRSRHGIFNKAWSLGLSIAGKKPDIDMEAFKKLMRGK